MKECGIADTSIRSCLSPPEAFFEMNRKLWHKKLVRRSIEKEDRIPSGKVPATDDDDKECKESRCQHVYCEIDQKRPRHAQKSAIIYILPI